LEDKMDARPRSSLPAVTERQREVARLVAEGLDNPSIAAELGISLAGAKYHVSELLGRLDLGSREEIGDWYRQQKTPHGGRRRLGGLGWLLGAASGAAAGGVAAVAIVFGSGGDDGAPTVGALNEAAEGGGFVAAAAPVSGARLQFAATGLGDGRVLVTGGILDGRTALPAEVYDPATGLFTRSGMPLTQRQAHEAVLLADGRVLLVGGFTATLGGSGSAEALETTELWDPTTGEFEAGPSMAEGRSEQAVVRLADGRVLVSGGTSLADGPDGPMEPLASAELYDPVTGQFEATGSMRVARRGHSLTLLEDGRVLASGGGPLEVYEPSSGRFELLAVEPVFGDERTVATRLPDGRVLITGAYLDGVAWERGDSRRSVGAYVVDVERGEARRVGDLEAGRSYYHTGTLLEDGRVLIAGGVVGFTSAGGVVEYAPPELFDPETETFWVVADAPSDAVPGGLRATNLVSHIPGHAAVALGDGSVLLVGSLPVGAGGSIELGAEAFDPRALDGEDAFGAFVARTTPRSQFEIAGAIDEEPLPFVGAGEPYGVAEFAAALGTRGLAGAWLTTGLGICAGEGRGAAGAGLRVTRTDGTGAVDFYLYLFASVAEREANWVVAEDGRAGTRAGTPCSEALGGRGGEAIPGEAWGNENVVAYLFPIPGGEADAATATEVIEALLALDEPLGAGAPVPFGPGVGEVLTADEGPRLGPVGAPFGMADLVRSAAGQGLQLRDLRFGAGSCQDPANPYTGLGLRVEPIEGGAAEDVLVWVYSSLAEREADWVVSSSGVASGQPGTECGWFTERYSVTGVARGNVVVAFGFSWLVARDAEARAAIVEVVQGLSR
jgi:DNA-binding CsgD family transcriptional regulator